MDIIEAKNIWKNYKIPHEKKIHYLKLYMDCWIVKWDTHHLLHYKT